MNQLSRLDADLAITKTTDAPGLVNAGAAVAFTLDGKTVLVTTERRPAPVYRLELPKPQKP